MKVASVNHPSDIQFRQSLGGTGGSVQQVWPNYGYPTWWPTPSTEDYANDVEVTEGEHDVTLSFYRKADSRSTGSRRVVKVITVPRSLWDGLTKRKK